MLDSLIQFVVSLQGNIWAPVVFVVSYVLACFFLPLSLFPVAGGVLFGFWGGLALNVAAPLIGAFASFCLSRYWIRGFVERWICRRDSKWGRFVMSKFSFWPFLTARLIAVPPFAMMNYAAGVSKISWQTFLAGTFLALLPWTIFLTFCSSALWSVFLEAGLSGFRTAVAQYTRPLLAAGLLLAMVVVISFVVKRKNRQKILSAKAVEDVQDNLELETQ